MNPAKLPAKLVKKPEVSLENLEIGQSAWVNWLEMAVDQDSNCFINPKARVQNEPTFSSVQVTRREEGFEVRIPADEKPLLYWEVGWYSLQKKDAEHYKQYVPIIRIEEIEKE
jgi:hypothetical protein